MAPTIRPLHHGDLTAFRALRLEALRLRPEAFGASHAEWERLGEAELAARVPLRPPSIIFGAFADESLVGMAGFLADTSEKKRHKGVLWGVYVRPEHRRRQLARRLVQRVIDHARAIGTEMVQLTVVAGNAGARRLYRDLGFVTYGVEPRALRLGPGVYHDEELQVLDLAPPQPRPLPPG